MSKKNDNFCALEALKCKVQNLSPCEQEDLNKKLDALIKTYHHDGRRMLDRDIFYSTNNPGLYIIVQGTGPESDKWWTIKLDSLGMNYDPRIEWTTPLYYTSEYRFVINAKMLSKMIREKTPCAQQDVVIGDRRISVDHQASRELDSYDYRILAAGMLSMATWDIKQLGDK